MVVGGRKSTPQSYSGIVGGQSTNFATIDSEIKVSYERPERTQNVTKQLRWQTAKLKAHGLAPPDLCVSLSNFYQAAIHCCPSLGW